jgi:hypothetical protein
VGSVHIWSILTDAPNTRDRPITRSHCSRFFFHPLDFPHHVSLSRGQYFFVQCPTTRSFGSASPTRANKGTTTMVTHPIQRRATSTNRTMPKILSLLPKTITQALVTRRRPKSTNQIIHPRVTIPITRLTANHPRQITTNHTLRLHILFTPSLHHRHHRHPFSHRTLLSPRTNLSLLATSTSPTSPTHV